MQNFCNIAAVRIRKLLHRNFYKVCADFIFVIIGLFFKPCNLIIALFAVVPEQRNCSLNAFPHKLRHIRRKYTRLFNRNCGCCKQPFVKHDRLRIIL